MTVFAASIIIVVGCVGFPLPRSQDLLYLLAKWRAVVGAGSVGVALCAHQVLVLLVMSRAALSIGSVNSKVGTTAA